MKKLILIASIFALSPATSIAKNAPAPKQAAKPLQHKAFVELGTGVATGNSENIKSLKTGLKSHYNQFTNQFTADFAKAEKDGDKKTNFKFNDKLKYDITEDYYAFGEGEYEKAKISGLNNQETGLVGMGYNIVKKDGVNIAAELSGGARQTSYTNNLANESSVIGKAGTIIDWTVYNNIYLNNNTSMAFTENNTQTTSDSSVKTYVCDSAYVKASLDIENNSRVPNGVKKTDTITSIGAGYEF